MWTKHSRHCGVFASNAIAAAAVARPAPSSFCTTFNKHSITPGWFNMIIRLSFGWHTFLKHVTARVRASMAKSVSTSRTDWLAAYVIACKKPSVRTSDTWFFSCRVNTFNAPQALLRRGNEVPIAATINCFNSCFGLTQRTGMSGKAMACSCIISSKDRWTVGGFNSGNGLRNLIRRDWSIDAVPVASTACVSLTSWYTSSGKTWRWFRADGEGGNALLDRLAPINSTVSPWPWADDMEDAATFFPWLGEGAFCSDWRCSLRLSNNSRVLSIGEDRCWFCCGSVGDKGGNNLLEDAVVVLSPCGPL